MLTIARFSNIYLFRRPLALALAVAVPILLMGKAAGRLDRVGARDPARFLGHALAVTGTVANHPDPRPAGCVYTVSSETVEIFDTDDIERYSAHGDVLVYVVRSSTPIAAPGDRVRVVGRLQKPRGATVPGAFDYESYLETQGIHALMYAGPNAVTNLGPATAFSWRAWGWRAKRRAVAAFERHLPPEEAAVLSGLAVGNRPRFFPEIKRVFLESGTMHVLVASGSNVAFVVMLWYFALRLLRVRHRWSFGTALVPIWSYVLLVGAEAPIVRAGVMGTTAIAAYLSKREDRSYHALVLAAWAILLARPGALFDIGFQMSFLTVFGLVYYLTPIESGMEKIPRWGRWPLRVISATLTAQIWLVPVTTNAFHRFFPISLVSNIVVVPLAIGGLPAGLALALKDVLHVPFPAAPIHWYMRLLIDTVGFFADRLGTSVWVAPFNAAMIAGFYAVCLSMPAAVQSRWAQSVLAMGILLFAGGFIVREKTFRPPTSLTVTWLDTGRNLATLIETPDGVRALVNPGPALPYDSSERVIMPYLANRGIRHLDLIVITDPRADQTAGAVSLAKWTGASIVDLTGSTSTTVVGTLAFRALGKPETKFERPMMATFGNQTLLFARGFSSRAQKEFLSLNRKELTVFQGRFSPKMHWNEEFFERYRPKLLVEVSLVSERRPSVPPWDKVPVAIPQKTGWHQYVLDFVLGD